MPLADETLAGLDWVMASVHSGFDRSRDELTHRLQEAMRNPQVDCIGHPTGRKINRRDPYELDFEALLQREEARVLEMIQRSLPADVAVDDPERRVTRAAPCSIRQRVVCINQTTKFDDSEDDHEEHD
mgnify:CR=1 FL=1